MSIKNWTLAQWIFALSVSIFVLSIVPLFFYVIPNALDREHRAEEIAAEMGCKYIGSARDLGSVKFLDCDGEIKLIQVK